jgi:alanyl-tRNA synthetase
MTAQEIRERFVAYFAAHGHTAVPSSPLVPADDPTLLFTNAGMNQFKDVFLGKTTRSYRRAVTVQKCVRAGGKHNDLDMVGRTARHQTFFEMLGNFSFGDYFKAEAIAYAWEFMTAVMGLKPEDLWVTVYRDDDEAFQLWQDVAHVPPERIVRLGEEENFWSMGDTGPCGPCSEILIDRGAEWACGPHCGIGQCDCDRFEELWNLVFMQYDRAADGTLTPLPRPSIDTGMGLERLAAVMQGVRSNFDTDLLHPLIEATERLTGRIYDSGPDGMPFRVIADHVRCVVMLLTDGVQFSNLGRGYVMRRILRRAVRYGRVLGMEGPFLYRLVPVVGEIMGRAYPEVLHGQEVLAAQIRSEEERFHQTLESGLRLLESLLAEVEDGVLAGDKAFVLYDTYGFPLDLTVDAAAERGIRVDQEGFEQAMAERRRQSRTVGGRRDWPERPASRFVGYERLEADSPLELFDPDGAPLGLAGEGEHVLLYLPTTPFYPEGGGQVGDQGTITTDTGTVRVDDTQKADGAIWHLGRVVSGEIYTGQTGRAAVDAELRAGAMRNHTGTHLLHAALRQVLGPGARQTGSLVAPDRLRFDFSHPEPMTDEQIRAVEDVVNRWIVEDRAVTVREATLAEAQAAGALAFFGEKYGERVRMVEVVGASLELCGGTHCRHTGQIGSLRIVQETGIGSGVRRVEALTGLGALNWSRHESALLREVAEAVAARPEDVLAKVAALKDTVRRLEGELEQHRQAEVRDQARRLTTEAETVGGWRAVVAGVGPVAPEDLRILADNLRDEADVVVLGSDFGGKAHLVVWVGPRARSGGLGAGRLIKPLAARVGGGGGGRDDFAQAGGRNPEGLNAALEEARRILASQALQDIPS